MIDVATDAQREIDLLWFQSQDLAAQDVGRRFVIESGVPQERVITDVASVARVGQVEIHEGRLDEVGPTLVFCLAQGRRVGVGQVI